MPRVAVLGLDAAEWAFVDSMMADGALPALAGIRDRSAAFRLGVDNPLWLERIWEVALSGGHVPPNDTFDPRTYEIRARGARLTPPLYRRAGAPSVVALDVPYLSPAHAGSGPFICGWCVHAFTAPPAARPHGLLGELESTFGPHPGRVSQHVARWHRPRSMSSLTDDLVRGVRIRPGVHRWLLGRAPEWDLFISVLGEAHGAGELMWHGVDPEHPLCALPLADAAGRGMRRVYGAIDEAVGRMVDDLPQDAYVIVTSPHGMTVNGADVASTVLLPELLYRLHAGGPYMRPFRNARSPVVPAAWQWWVSAMDGRFPGSSFGLIRDKLPAVTDMALGALHLRSRSAELETDVPLEQIGEPTTTMDGMIALQYARFWPRMRAFALPSYSQGHVRINLVARERDGVVDVSDYEKVCEEIEQHVRSCVDPRTGRSVVAEVIRARGSDPLDPDDPEHDLVFVWEQCPDTFEHPTAGTIGPVPYHRTGGHSRRGFAFVSGPGIEPRDGGERSVLDLAPTISALLGQSIPADIQGRSLLEDTPART